MLVQNSTKHRSYSKDDVSPGFLVMAMGGAGKASVMSVKKQHEAAGQTNMLDTHLARAW